MPSGKNKVPMAQLRDALTLSGFENVRTWIQSGNVLLRTHLDRYTLRVRVQKVIRDGIGPDLGIIVKTASELQTVIEENPFIGQVDRSRIFFSLFNDIPEKQKIDTLLEQDFSPGWLLITSHAAYMFIPGVYGRGRLSNQFLEKKLKITATMRNFNTLSKLIELST